MHTVYKKSAAASADFDVSGVSFLLAQKVLLYFKNILVYNICRVEYFIL